jgi:hypothetical protein
VPSSHGGSHRFESYSAHHLFSSDCGEIGPASQPTTHWINSEAIPNSFRNAPPAKLAKRLNGWKAKAGGPARTRRAVWSSRQPDATRSWIFSTASRRVLNVGNSNRRTSGFTSSALRSHEATPSNPWSSLGRFPPAIRQDESVSRAPWHGAQVNVRDFHKLKSDVATHVGPASGAAIRMASKRSRVAPSKSRRSGAPVSTRRRTLRCRSEDSFGWLDVMFLRSQTALPSWGVGLLTVAFAVSLPPARSISPSLPWPSLPQSEM